MDIRDLFQKHRQILLFTQLVGGSSLRERIRNLSWIIELLDSGDTSWDLDELVILAESSTPFLPAKEILEEITRLKLLALDPRAGVYKLNDPIDFYEAEMPVVMGSQDCRMSLAELRNLLNGGPSKRVVWSRPRLLSILSSMSDFGFHCIQSWRSLVVNNSELDGVPFLWNVASDGRTTPMGELPASSATLDIIRLAVEPLNFVGIVPSSEQLSLIQWAFDQVLRCITFTGNGRAYYLMSVDDSYPNAAHPINDSQARVIHLLTHLLYERYLDEGRRQQVREALRGLANYVLDEQLLAPGEIYDGFWSFHKYNDRDLDGFHVLTINSELAVKALEDLWQFADEELRTKISRGIAKVVAALRRTAIRNVDSIAWQKNFSTLERGISGAKRGVATQIEQSVVINRGAGDIFSTARAMLIFASAKSMDVCDDGKEYIEGALRFLEENWVVELKNLQDDVEFIPYRTPESARWSDVTYRITNPISAIMPYFVLKSSRIGKINLPIILTEPVNNCMNFALDNYEDHGFWRDAPTGLAYPTNTAFNMEMLIEYLRASEA